MQGHFDKETVAWALHNITSLELRNSENVYIKQVNQQLRRLTATIFLHVYIDKPFIFRIDYIDVYSTNLPK